MGPVIQILTGGYPSRELEIAMFPEQLIVDYWMKVANFLVKNHRLKRDKAEKGITDYLAVAEKHGFTDLIYHRDARDVAETIAGAVRNGGFREPVVSSKP